MPVFQIVAVSAGAEAGGPSIQTQHLRGIWTGQLWRPVHQRAHPAHARRRVSRFFICAQCTDFTLPDFSFSILFFFFFRDVVKKIDQSEFEGFEYINPLLMSAEECVWETRRLSSWTPPTHTPLQLRVYVASQCLQAAWLRDDPATSTFCSRASHAHQNAYLPKPVSHSAIYYHLPLNLPSFFNIFFIHHVNLLRCQYSPSGASPLVNNVATKVLPRSPYMGAPDRLSITNFHLVGCFQCRFICTYIHKKESATEDKH